MKPRLLVIFLFIVVLPIGVTVWLGIRLVGDEREMVRLRHRELLADRLGDVAGQVNRVLERWERELLQLLEKEYLSPADAGFKALARQPQVRHLFTLDADGKLTYPNPDKITADGERQFLLRSRQLWLDGVGFDQSGDTVAASHGWHTWYWGDGINLVFWYKRADSTIIGAEIDRIRLLMDIIAAMPDAGGTSGTMTDRIAIRSAKGSVIYQWGRYIAPDEGVDEVAFASVPLQQPLGSWSLDYFPSPEHRIAAVGSTITTALIAGIGGLALALVVLAVYFYRESTRDMREAGTRVNFVNQVSHELKTPLTNIRMYAEMLADRAVDGDPTTQRYLDVVVTESQRLSRLISNVLTFARHQRGRLTLQRTAGNIDSVVTDIVEQFRPQLEKVGVEVMLAPGAPATVQFDGDAVEQIVGNLLSNIAKYAADGRGAEITTSQSGHSTIIRVTDHGPGIPHGEGERVFMPFYRLSAKISEGSAGTGIGLSIARELARLHGGELRLIDSDGGATFEVELATPALAQQTAGAR